MDTPESCPFCHTESAVGGGCPHHVATLCDDSDGFDTSVPLYFITSDRTGAELEQRAGVFFETLVERIQKAAREGKVGRTTLAGASSRWGAEEKHLVEAALACLDESAEDEVDEVLRSELGGPMKEFFAGLHRRCAGEPAVSDYEIAHSPGLTWTGTYFWARDRNQYRQSAAEVWAKATQQVAES